MQVLAENELVGLSCASLRLQISPGCLQATGADMEIQAGMVSCRLTAALIGTCAHSFILSSHSNQVLHVLQVSMLTPVSSANLN